MLCKASEHNVIEIQVKVVISCAKLCWFGSRIPGFVT